MNNAEHPAGPENGSSTFASLDSVLICIDIPGDTTVRPRPANIPRGWPPEASRRPQPLPSEPPLDQA